MASQRARSTKSLSRKPPSRNSRDRALIVCEGEKTEPQYFLELIADLGLTSADVRICGKECGSDPKSIYEYAMHVFGKDGDYDAVFCVFDRDGHATFDWACNKIAKTALPGARKVFCIKSIPCFEFWIILHFVYRSSPIVGAGKKSAGDKAFAEVRKYLPSYTKGGRGLYGVTKEKIHDAIKRSRRMVAEADSSGSDNPVTLVHELIEHLFKMRDNNT